MLFSLCFVKEQKNLSLGMMEISFPPSETPKQKIFLKDMFIWVFSMKKYSILNSPCLMNLGSGSRSGPLVILPQVHLLSDSLLPCSSFPGGDDLASGGAICPIFAQPFAGDERILQVCPPLLFPSAVRDGAPQTL
jgi:hypothetical protein